MDGYAYYFEAFKKSKLGEPIAPEDAPSPEAVNTWYQINKGMIGWASPAVIKAVLKLGNAGPDNPEQGIRELDEVLLAMRKDLGLTNRGLQPGDLLQVLLTPEARSEWQGKRDRANQNEVK